MTFETVPFEAEAEPAQLVVGLRPDVGQHREEGQDRRGPDRVAHDRQRPAGPQAVGIDKPRSTVLRYNDFIGSDQHRWNDAIEGAGNYHVDGGFSRRQGNIKPIQGVV